MKTIKFSEEELSLLRNMYEDELAQAENYVGQIKDVLKKLGAPVKESKEIPIEKEPKAAKKRGRKPKAKVLATKVPKKRGRPKRVIVPTINEAAPIKVAKPAKKAKPQKKITAKPKVAKKTVIKKAPKVVPNPVSVPTTESKQFLKKEVKRVVKKKTGKRRFPQRGVRLASLSKPLPKKEPMTGAPSQIESAVENPHPVELSNPSVNEVKE